MNKTVIAGGIVAVAIAVSIAYGAVANPGEMRKNVPIQRFGISVFQDQNFMMLLLTNSHRYH